MTRKLYYEDSHMTEFRATVTGCEQTEKGWEVTLDQTAFYPEGGGQPWDLGILGGVRVVEVQERGEEVIHYCDGPLEPGTGVAGKIDWIRRLDLMQQHSGEHLVSGLVHSHYGYHNVGFHMGAEVMTVDFDGVIPAEDIAKIEEEANDAIWKNLPIRCWYPSPEELPTVGYRTKKALPWPVRIVEIPGYDKCACCGTQVKATGEIGLVKIFGTVGFRGGTRMELSCGKRAMKALNLAYDQNRQVCQAFSLQVWETGEGARRMNDMLAAEKYKVVGLQRKLMDGIAASYAGAGDCLCFQEDLDSGLVRELADKIAAVCGGVAAVFSGTDETGYGYCLVTREGDLRQLGKEMTGTLHGRGGGKPNAQQGRVQATEAEIRSFFAAGNARG